MPSSSDPYTTELELEEPKPTGLARLNRLNVALLVLSLLSLSAGLYLSPIGDPVQRAVDDQILDLSPPAGAAPVTPEAPPSARAKITAKSKAATPPSTAPTTPGAMSAVMGTATSPTGETGGIVSQAGTKTKKNKKKVKHVAAAVVRTTCSQFTWQQDAQAVYLKNLSDPYGLDAGKGPYNGDGLACSDLPVDPERPASKPVGAYSPPAPSAAAKARLVTPDQDYFGFSQDGIPGDTKMFDALAAETGKAPSSVGWFANWDETYRGDLVTKAWSRGALPVVTWMPVQGGSGNNYSLSSIANGTWDKYLRRFAGDVVRTDLPVAIRLMHEMNHGAYPWAAGRTEWNNSPAKYVAAWRHIWEVFDEVGATDDVIWLWSPSRVDNLKPGVDGNSEPAASYPGDAYVDWVGASMYLRQGETGPTFDATFGKTLQTLKSITDKPVFVAETAAVQTDAGKDLTSVKAQWTTSLLRTFAQRSDLVGLLWFNNSTSVVDGDPMDADWRFDSSTAALEAFKQGVASSAFLGGVMPD